MKKSRRNENMNSIKSTTIIECVTTGTRTLVLILPHFVFIHKMLNSISEFIAVGEIDKWLRLSGAHGEQLLLGCHP